MPIAAEEPSVNEPRNGRVKARKPAHEARTAAARDKMSAGPAWRAAAVPAAIREDLIIIYVIGLH